jgi:hypothetical protein
MDLLLVRHLIKIISLAWALSLKSWIEQQQFQGQALQDYFGKRARKGKLLGLKRKGEISGFTVA